MCRSRLGNGLRQMWKEIGKSKLKEYRYKFCMEKLWYRMHFFRISAAQYFTFCFYDNFTSCKLSISLDNETVLHEFYLSFTTM